MRIGIDARFYGPEGTGIGRYVEKLIENLEELDTKNEYFVFLRAANFPLYTPKAPNFTKIKADARWYSIKEQMIMPAVLLKQKLDLVHFPHFNIPLLYPGNFVVTIHDLTKSNFGSAAASNQLKPVYLVKQNMYRFTLNQAVSKAKMILTPSEYVKDNIAKKFLKSNEKILVTYEGADEFYDPNFSVSEGKSREIFNKYSIKPPYLLFVGNTYPYKNVDVILKALNLLPEAITLVCVAPRNSFLEKLTERARELGVRNRLITTGFVRDEELKILFKQALCFVFPSRSEGFGLPGLEAMGVGCPVISSSATALPEIYEDAAVYFEPNDEKELVSKILNLQKNQKKRTELIAKGFQQVRKYSWKSLAEQTLKVYNIVLDKIEKT